METQATTTSSLSSMEDAFSEISILVESPLKLIGQGGKYGIKGVGKIFMITILFGGVNFLLSLYGVYREATANFSSTNLFYLILMLILGVVVTILAGFQAYNYVRVDAFRVIYEKIRPYFPGLCAELVDRVADQKVDPNNPNIQQALGIASFFNTTFQKLPNIIRRFLMKKLERIPFSQFFRELHTEMVKGNRQAVAQTIYQRTDNLLSETFRENSNHWILWVLPLNIAVQILIALQIN